MLVYITQIVFHTTVIYNLRQLIMPYSHFNCIYAERWWLLQKKGEYHSKILEWHTNGVNITPKHISLLLEWIKKEWRSLYSFCSVQVYCNQWLSYTFIDSNIQPTNCITGDVRLVNGVLESEGRLEVCINQVWGTVCGRSWSFQDSVVACRQLGHQELGTIINCSIIIHSCWTGATYGYSTYGQGSDLIAFGYMYCTGDEDSLFQCDRSVFTVASGSCTNHYYDLGLKCERKQVHKIKVTICFHYHQLFVKKEPFALKTAHHQLVVV